MLTQTIPSRGGAGSSQQAQPAGPAALPLTLCPAPGIYEGVSMDDYMAWDAMNNSGMGRFLRSPAHYLVDKSDDETKAKSRGTICHAGIWEPDRFRAEYAIGPRVKLNTKAGKDEWQAFADANPGKFHVRGEDGEAMMGARYAIWSHPEAKKLLSCKGPCELSIVWNDAETGVRCKSRIDKVALDYRFVVDLKTTRDARPRSFARSIRDYNYHMQAAFNVSGLMALGGKWPLADGFAIIAVEMEPPHGLIVYDLIHWLDRGHREMREGLRAYAACLETGNFPCYPTAIREIEMPEWMNQDEEL